VRLVYRDEAAGVKRNIKKVSPIIEHTSDGGIACVGEAVLAQLVEVHEERDDHYCTEAQALP
jgi:hypothetical protein